MFIGQLSRRAFGSAAAVAGISLTLVAVSGLSAHAAQSDPGLGTAGGYSILATSTVTNTGTTTIENSVGLSPGTSVTGFPPAVITQGTLQETTAAAATAVADARTGYDDAVSRGPAAAVAADLTGQTLLAGVYGGPTLGLTGQLTLDGQGNPDSTFIFQAASTLTTGSASQVLLINGANACHVFWQVGSSATLGTASSFAGTLLAHDSVTATTDAAITGRLVALDGAVTLDTNTITSPTCQPPATPTGPVVSSASPSPSPSASPSSSAPSTGGTNGTASASAGTSTPAASATRAPAKSAAETAALVAGAVRTGDFTGRGQGSGPRGPQPVLPPQPAGGAGHGGHVSVPTGHLAYTGANVNGLLALGLLAIGLGAGLLVSMREFKGAHARHR